MASRLLFSTSCFSSSSYYYQYFTSHYKLLFLYLYSLCTSLTKELPSDFPKHMIPYLSTDTNEVVVDEEEEEEEVEEEEEEYEDK